MMANSSNLDDEARAELLCYLVVGQLVARARTGSWLRTDHVVEILSIWANGNGAQVDWLDRLHLGALSEQVVLDFAELPGFADSDSLAQLFTDGWRLDYRSPIARRIYKTCEDGLEPSQDRLTDVSALRPIAEKQRPAMKGRSGYRFERLKFGRYSRSRSILSGSSRSSASARRERSLRPSADLLHEKKQKPIREPRFPARIRFQPAPLILARSLRDTTCGL
jgi:hypothetical protein